MIAGFGILAFRDPHGIRPVAFGKRPSSTVSGAWDYMFASESVALDTLGFREHRSLLPGEAVIVTKDGRVTARQLVSDRTFAPCIFEYVYFARPDSILDGASVYRTRMRMGEKLAERAHQVLGDQLNDVDVIIPIPDTSRVSALEMAKKLGKEYREGFIKNRYVGRTFIMPGQQERRASVRRKLNAMALEFHGKNVLLVDGTLPLCIGLIIIMKLV